MYFIFEIQEKIFRGERILWHIFFWGDYNNNNNNNNFIETRLKGTIGK